MESLIFLEKYCGKMIKNAQELESQPNRRNNWRYMKTLNKMRIILITFPRSQ